MVIRDRAHLSSAYATIEIFLPLKEESMADRTRINLSEENEVQYWSERVGLTPERLREVVNEVGNSVERVREKLGWQKTA